MGWIRGKKLWLAAFLAGVVLLCGYGAAWRAVPQTLYVSQKETQKVASLPWLRLEQPEKDHRQAGAVSADDSWNAEAKLLGVLPLKTVRVVAQPEQTVEVCGTPFGIKMFSDGALVVGFTDLYTTFGAENPAKEAGLRLGDVIISANGEPIRTNEQLSEVIRQAAGEEITLQYRRSGQLQQCSVTPIRDAATGKWKAGIWVRDSSAGIGTLTFVLPEQRRFAGLGHAISDSDTGTDLPLLSGEIVPVTITGVLVGAPGCPGELQGRFRTQETMGTVTANQPTGIYGALDCELHGAALPVAVSAELCAGDAQIRATVEGETPHWYDVKIEKVHLAAKDPNRNLLVRITDPELLQKTGGIVQGMSGSPIVQNGKFVGAITHVLVNDPTRGYGILAEHMLEAAKQQ